MDAHPRPEIIDWIRRNWDQSVGRDRDGSGFAGIDLPHPYTTPCVRDAGKFSFFFYWDTYFTNVGLLLQDRLDLAQANIRNMVWLIGRHGFMPNHVGIDHRSQTPYFGLMVAECADALARAEGEDAIARTAFLAQAAPAVRQEYFFWREARATTIGLTRCGQSATRDYLEQFYDRFLVRRLGLSPEVDSARKIEIAAHRVAECESWDFTERFDGRALDFAVVEFNANLYAYETLLERWAQELGWDEPDLWGARASERRERVDRYLWNEERGLYLDYDVANDRAATVAAATTFQPLYTRLASPDQARRVAANLPLFEREYGLAVTEETPGCRSYQWAYPNMWPPIVWVAVAGLARYGLHDDARRLAAVYVDVCNRLFEETGQLWEKIDVETGAVAGGEYDAQPMLGWSAGIYLACAEYLHGAD
jgi:alpha,alpha-trehalase